MRAAATSFITPLLWLVVIVLAMRFALAAANVFTRPSDGFASYYTAGRLLRDGQAGARWYDDRWFGDQVADVVPGVKDIYRPNPPTTAFIMFPLSWTSYAAARTLWITSILAMVAVCLFLVLRETELRGPLAPLFAGAVLASQPLAANVRQGQVYVLLWTLTILMWIGIRRRQNGMAGISLGALLVLKTAGVLLPVLLLSRRHVRAIAWSGATIAAPFLISLVWMGSGIWKAYVVQLFGLRREPDLSVTAYQTVTSLFLHLLVYDSRWNPNPMFAAPTVARWSVLFVALGMTALTILVTLRARDDDVAFATLLTLTIMLSPVSLDYHYILLLLPFAIVMKRLQSSRNPGAWLIFIASALLVLSDLPYNSPRFSEAAWALLAYPKLAGALLLWAQGLWIMRREPAAVTSASARLVTVPG